MTDDSYKLANDRELIEMRHGAVEDLAEYRDNLAAIDAEIRERGLAHTTTDDEREAGRLAIERVLKACMLTFATSYEDAASMAIDKVIAAGFRRSEVPEPSAERYIEYRASAESDDWVIAIAGASQRDIDASKRENELQGWEKYRVVTAAPESEGEPSDVEVRAAALAMYQRQNSLSMSGATTPARAALRAAGGVR